MVELIVTAAGALSPATAAYFFYRAKRERMKRDEKLIERARPEDIPKIARALNPPHQLGPWRRNQSPPADGEPDTGQGA